jgi:hypothetical protein
LQYSDDALLTNILERDQIVFYEVPVSLKKENNDTILMPCLFRTADSLHQNFGLPIYLNIPRHKCTGRHIHDALQVNCPLSHEHDLHTHPNARLEFDWSLPTTDTILVNAIGRQTSLRCFVRLQSKLHSDN